MAHNAEWLLIVLAALGAIFNIADFCVAVGVVEDLEVVYFWLVLAGVAAFFAGVAVSMAGSSVSREFCEVLLGVCF